MRTLHIDIETYSSVDLKKFGVYRYAEAPDFEVLLFGYSEDGGPVHVVDLAAGEALPKSIVNALIDESVFKSAFNAAFERVCLSAFLRKLYEQKQKLTADEALIATGGYIPPVNWRCTSVMSAYAGITLSLEGVQNVLGLREMKKAEGKSLISFFSKPCKPTASNGQRTRNLPDHAPEKWFAFTEYCAQDVAAEIELYEYLEKNAPLPPALEWEFYELDQQINDRGVLIDIPFVDRAMEMDSVTRMEALKRIVEITKGKVVNPQSVVQLKNWLGQMGYPVDSLNAEGVNVLLDKLTNYPSPYHAAAVPVKKVLRLRQEISKSSVKKYRAMKDCVCADGRARGLFRFYGAQMGRWAGRLIQVQNLPRGRISEIDFARALVSQGDTEAVELLYGSVAGTLSALTRTAFIPAKGKIFSVADFSAIEARVIAWLAGEKWRNDVFAAQGKIYEASAARMFRVPIDSITKDSPLRQKGKIAELALGYGGGVGALKAMGALSMGLKESELQPLVDVWRASNPAIVQLWKSVDTAVKTVVRERLPEKKTLKVKGLSFYFKPTFKSLVIGLPSKRELCYYNARIQPGKYGDAVVYDGAVIGGKWEAVKSYGPKFVENIVQTISRDLLAGGMTTVERDYVYMKADIVMHVHDEIVVESSIIKKVKPNSPNVPVRLNILMPHLSIYTGFTNFNWVGDLLLKAESFSCESYHKS